jgi:L-aminopeptidase/D-esterase-like protein
MTSPDGTANLPSLYPGSITTIEGISVGHASVTGRPSGCTVVLCPPATVGGVEVRGGAPGTRETDLLHPGNWVEHVDAVLLTGGSAYGLDAAGGVMRWLEAQGRGLPVGRARVPIVPAAVLFDLWLGESHVRPDAQTGWDACDAAGSAPPAQGNVGAGLGATVGKLWGLGSAMKGGLGTASLQVGAVNVGAIAAVNAAGDVLVPDGRVLAGARDAAGTGLRRSTASVLAGDLPPRMAPGFATTLAVVATDARLDKAQTHKLAALAHHGLPRAIDPILMSDGDTVFSLATGRSGHQPDLGLLGAIAAEVLRRAIVNAVLAAETLDRPWLPAARSLVSVDAAP